ncbi:MAG TPA: STAS domain-containing protein [Methylomirabilota bacterium]|nr:STAS domain-containing protein [Methylomirabilota bacterium]
MIESDSAMELAARRLTGVVVLSPVGRIGHDEAEPFRHALEAYLDACSAGSDAVVLDLAGVEYVSSAGLRALLLAARQVKAQGGTLVVAAMQPFVQEVFEISRFTLLFRTFASVRDALVELSPAAVAAFEAGRPRG